MKQYLFHHQICCEGSRSPLISLFTATNDEAAKNLVKRMLDKTREIGKRGNVSENVDSPKLFDLLEDREIELDNRTIYGYG